MRTRDEHEWTMFVWGVANGLVLMALVLLLALQCGCATDVSAPKTPGVLVGEQYCDALGLPCGHVYEFVSGAELCVLDELLAEAEAAHGESRLSTHERFDDGNLCYWQCPTAKGCNAFSGCFCGATLAAFVGRVSYALTGAGDVGLDTCDSASVKPAISCGSLSRLEFDECRWRCVSILPSIGERQ
jgi:hypothetical protein